LRCDELTELDSGLRRWALDNRPAFTLIFGTPLPGYHAREQANP